MLRQYYINIKVLLNKQHLVADVYGASIRVFITFLRLGILEAFFTMALDKSNLLTIY